MTQLPELWFVLIAVLFTGYFVLEGFDFGVGLLLPFLGRDERTRGALLKTIGPVWDGNEVWLITAGGALFAAFPEWYATLFSGMYLPLFLILVALILRIVGLEWRKQVNDATWRRWCDAAIIIGSWGPALLWGLVFSNIIAGMPIQADFTLDSLDALAAMLNPYALLGAAAFTALFTLHGLAFIRLKTTGDVRDQARKAFWPVFGLAAVTAVPYAVWTVLAHDGQWWIAGIAVLCAVAGMGFMLANRDGLAFLSSTISVVAVAALLFVALFPNVMPTTLVDGASLDIWNASSNPYTLRILTWTALILTPLVLAYQGWTYWVFRKRIRADRIDAPAPALQEA
ncbi:cytochrome d ubiquinol oxidase, subunit II [Corynebacterium efficiens YS-314]|uniref:Putative cytochrome D ubiquinol oxidase subunit II n=1 Tax=Corynebacterium efficiens (strain DSM 44549 / YS-314 / AJ 12310 / JCM 11189 / NBRC 100395) TaxID=196164 RepID=Q8FQ81_COREF|nr:cytochrome d ubiquinol oxidase subunit II [Corynebacterium efficiens]EEW50729.1 cytochrome d ubiquinol oxidase, subunit II [Corynebacterium efficiens YS-314]BAC18062.1 putative cytochrome D ubiquinol oxidase subunit II [Corynebacterium efficiens YS-314]